MLQVHLTRFGVFPAVEESVFAGPIDSWDGGEQWDGVRWIEQAWEAKKPRVLFPYNSDEAFVLVNEDNVAVEAYQSPLPGIPVIEQDDWNREWSWSRDEDLDRMTFFEARE